jgi:hypothetical protein
MMNKTAIKNFAIWARNKLIADICYRAGLMGITEKGIADALPQSTLDAQFYDIGAAEPYLVAGEAIKQRRQLVEVIRDKEKDSDYRTAYQYVMEEVAYTWFNRLIAVRFMEVNDYLPSHLRVLSSESGKVEPDLVTTPFDAELPFTAEEEAQIIQWKQDNKLDELFRFLFIKQCNALNEILPGLFEKTTDYTEVLLNLSVVDQESVVYKLTHDIPENDFNVEQGGQVEIIGWLYQYYNTALNEQVYDGRFSKDKIPKELLPAATTIYTPDWAIRYMVENSLGRLWVEGHPDSDLRKNWKYYLDEAPQEPEVQAKLATIRKEYAALSPEDLTLIDPCMGSGHILVYAFDVLMQIYESVGYSQRDAAKSILEHNLYGLDIDDRAYQLAYFAVMMKARQYNRRILNGENTCHVHAIQESNSINRAHLKFFGAGLSDLEKNTAKMQMEGLLDILTDAKEYGSILNVPEYNWDLLCRFAADVADEAQVSFESAGVEETAEQLRQLVELSETMGRKYWVTVTNPPYLGSSRFSAKLNNYIAKNYSDTKADLSMVMYKHALHDMCQENGFVSFITTTSWMFLSSFEKLRFYVLSKFDFESLVDFGTELFDGKVGHNPIVAWVNRKSCTDNKMTGIRLVDYCYSRRDEKETEFFNKKNYYYPTQRDFSIIPGSPVAYWVSKNVILAFENGVALGTIADSKQGVATADNNRFLRLWNEVDIKKIEFSANNCEEAAKSAKKWFPYNKGGDFRRWYGNNDYVVNWENDGNELRNFRGSVLRNPSYYFQECFSWSLITSGTTAFRYKPNGFIFDVAGMSCFSKLHVQLMYLLALCNTKVIYSMLKIIAPTINCQCGDVARLPVVLSNDEVQNQTVNIANDCVAITRDDWDAFETSWDFKVHPLVYLSKGLWDATAIAATMDYYYGYLPEASCSLEICYLLWQGQCKERFEKLKANEEELNRIFIDIYGLQDELTPEVEEKDVTVRKADLLRDIKSLLSYAVGCMFGRYSLDVPGLVLAGQPFEEKFVHASNAVTGTGVLGAPGLLRAPGALYLRTEDGVKQCTFAPDVDNVIPITDEEYLEDDIIARLCDWLKVVYGADTLEANLDYIAKALGNKGTTSREVIRNYFVNDFFKDHCQTYSVTGSGKRPIYWLFDSGKQNGFKALVYLHRYTPDTIGTLRVDYLHKMQRVYESEINRMQDMMDHTTNAREAAAASKRKDKLTKQLKECRDYDEKISHLALSRIALDLDDGVKVNYRKLQTAADGKFYEVLADSKNIMVKEKK